MYKHKHVVVIITSLLLNFASKAQNFDSNKIVLYYGGYRVEDTKPFLCPEGFEYLKQHHKNKPIMDAYGNFIEDFDQKDYNGMSIDDRFSDADQFLIERKKLSSADPDNIFFGLSADKKKYLLAFRYPGGISFDLWEYGYWDKGNSGNHYYVFPKSKDYIFAGTESSYLGMTEQDFNKTHTLVPDTVYTLNQFRIKEYYWGHIDRVEPQARFFISRFIFNKKGILVKYAYGYFPYFSTNPLDNISELRN